MLGHLGFIMNLIILAYISVSFPPKMKFLDETLLLYKKDTSFCSNLDYKNCYELGGILILKTHGTDNETEI